MLKLLLLLALKVVGLIAKMTECRFDGKDHWPIYDSKTSRSQCKIRNCGFLTHWMCQKCDTHVCINRTRNCFVRFHKENVCSIGSKSAKKPTSKPKTKPKTKPITKRTKPAASANATNVHNKGKISRNMLIKTTTKFTFSSAVFIYLRN